MKEIEIYTANSSYENGKCVGGYHEIHKIKYLQNIDHLIATIDSIIKNNLLYGCNDTVLESVIVSCDNPLIANSINEHYNGKCGKVKIEVELQLEAVV